MDRSKRQAPGFTFVGLLTLAPGIGANNGDFRSANPSALDHIQCKATQRSFLVARLHVAPGFVHRFDDLIERHLSSEDSDAQDPDSGRVVLLLGFS